jgi:hypothetical protein
VDDVKVFTIRNALLGWTVARLLRRRLAGR